jgi:ABC-type branched-subunit amino acid transport system substrate-binding protein
MRSRTITSVWSRRATLWTMTSVVIGAAACGGGASTALHPISAQDHGVQVPQQQQSVPSGGQQPQTQGQTAQHAVTPVQPSLPQQRDVLPAGGTTANQNRPPAPVLPKPGAGPVGATANFGSDVGVTKDQINIGIINFASATRALGPPIVLASQRIDAALVQYINENGGVAGRKLNLVTCDDGGDVTRARACYEKLKTQVFAFVPSETFVTDTIHDSLAKDKVPWLTWGWFASEWRDPYMFPCHANGLHEAVAVVKWVAQNVHPRSVGIVYLNVSEDIAAKDEAIVEYQKHGINVVASIAQEWDSADESQHVLAMRVANPDIVMTLSYPTPEAKFIHDAEGQNWMPKLGYWGNHLTGDPGYGQIFGDSIKGHLNGFTSWIWPGAQNQPGADDLPALQLWRMLTARYTGYDLVGFHFKYVMGHHITQSALACTRILADVARQLGPNLTRTRFMQALETQAFDTGMGVTLKWPHGDHGQEPYSFNREYIYQWEGASDGTYELKRLYPDGVFIG